MKAEYYIQGSTPSCEKYTNSAARDSPSKRIPGELCRGVVWRETHLHLAQLKHLKMQGSEVVVGSYR